MKLKLTLIVVITLLLFEWFVRSFVVSPAVVSFDRQLGPMKAPYSRILRTYEGNGHYISDAYGLNNDQLPKRLPQRRLLILGDSYVEAKHVERSENFVSRLNARPETLAYNAGYSGADPRSFPVLTQRFRDLLQPTQYVLCVNAADLSALSSLTLPAYEPPEGIKALLQPLFANSALATHLNWKYKPVLEAWIGKWQLQEMEPGQQDPGGYAKHWAAILEQLKLEQKPILLVIMPSISYVAGKALIVDDVRAELLAKVAAEQGVAVLRTEQAFIEEFKESGEVALGFANSHLGTGHLNKTGHRIIAAEIMQALDL